MQAKHEFFAGITLFLLAFGCGVSLTRDVPIQFNYTKTPKYSTSRAGARVVAIGRFHDARSNRPAEVVGERKLFNGSVDRYRVRGGLSFSFTNIVKGYYSARGIRHLTSNWTGQPDQIWNQEGDIVISGRITNLWFGSTDTAAMAQASSIFRVEFIVGSPRSGTIITKSIQIEPKSQSNLHWETKDVEKWLNRSVAEAVERVLPDIERRLVN